MSVHELNQISRRLESVEQTLNVILQGLDKIGTFIMTQPTPAAEQTPASGTSGEATAGPPPNGAESKTTSSKTAAKTAEEPDPAAPESTSNTKTEGVTQVGPAKSS